MKSLPGHWRKSDNSYAKVRLCCKGRRLPRRCQVLTKKFRVIVFPCLMSQSQIGKKEKAWPMPCLCTTSFLTLNALFIRNDQNITAISKKRFWAWKENLGSPFSSFQGLRVLAVHFRDTHSRPTVESERLANEC